MKKTVTFILILFLSCLLVACNSDDSKEQGEEKSIASNVTFTGTIEEISAKKTALIVVEEGAILKSANKLYVDLSVNPTETFQVGDRVKVGYDGMVMESYPARIKTLSVERVE